ncbi:MAG: HD domain-containing protein [Bacteroidota bacterium]|nr:HD domain-containing protein [Bacteroidota bacterium]
MPDIIKAAEIFVNNHFNTELSSKYKYHNLTHTFNTVSEVIKIAEYHNLDAENKQYLILAGLFHDTGIIINYFNHERESCTIMERFLKKRQFSEDKIFIIKNLILSTCIKLKPVSINEKILTDADLSYLGSPGFFEGAALLREEWELVLGKYFNHAEWLQNNINFFNQHHYTTEYAEKFYVPQKKENLRILQAELAKLIAFPQRNYKVG